MPLEPAGLALFTAARHALKPGGRLVTHDGTLSPRQSWLARYMVGHDRGRFPRAPEAYLELARQVFPSARGRIFDGCLRIPYTTLVLECSRPD